MLRCLVDGQYSATVLSIILLSVTLADKNLGILGCGTMLLLEHLQTIRSTIFSSSPSFNQSHIEPSELQELLTQLQNVISKKVWILSNIAARIEYLSSFLFLGICMSLINELGVTAEVWVTSEVVHKVVCYLGWLDICIWLQKFGLCLMSSIRWCNILGGQTVVSDCRTSGYVWGDIAWELPRMERNHSVFLLVHLFYLLIIIVTLLHPRYHCLLEWVSNLLIQHIFQFLIFKLGILFLMWPSAD